MRLAGVVHELHVLHKHTVKTSIGLCCTACKHLLSLTDHLSPTYKNTSSVNQRSVRRASHSSLLTLSMALEISGINSWGRALALVYTVTPP